MLHQMHEAAYRVIFGGVVWNAGAAQQIADLLVRTDPNRQHGFSQVKMFPAVFSDHTGHGIRNLVGRSDRGLHIHDQDRIVARVGQQHLERCRITCSVGIADDVDRI